MHQNLCWIKIDFQEKWEKKILNIYGDTFSGKTHLAKIFQNKSKALYLTNNDVNEEIFKKIGKDKYPSMPFLFQADLNPFKKDRDKFFNKNIIIYTKLLGFDYHWEDKSYSELKEYREKAIKEFSVSEWYDVYKYKMLLFKKIENDMEIMDELSELFVLKSDDLLEKLNEKISELQSSNIKKNF